MTSVTARDAAPARDDWHARTAAEVAATLATDLAEGLSAAEAAERLDRWGANRLPEPAAPGPLRLLLRQFNSVLIYVLLVAAAISLALGDLLEFFAIIAIAVLNGVLGFVQEHRAEQALRALQSMSAPSAGVLRDGVPARVAASAIVPGDLLVLEAGDIAAADARIVQAASLAAGEAMLTGESVPVDKAVEPTSEPVPLAERSSMVYQGTLITRGRGRAVAVATGAATEMGRIALQVAQRPREETPLQRDLAHVGRYLVIAAALLCLLVFLIGVARGVETEEMFLTAASLAVAAIPEGLPAASTVVLALGVQRMAARNAIVRRLSSVEALGSVTIVYTDKTGTLTQNSMRVEQAWLAGAEEDLLRIGQLCNNAALDHNGAAATGDPTEIALLAYVQERRPGWRSSERRELEIPFDAGRARMSVVVRDEAGRRLGLSKGATGQILARCARIGEEAASPRLRSEIEAQAATMARAGLRVLALAQRPLADETDPDEVERDLALVGLVGMADPLRPEAAASIDEARAAGISVVMLTGDQRETAESIGRALGLEGDVVSGPEIDELDAAALADRLVGAAIFARVTSEHKLRIVEASRAAGHIVAMTGDGVNDAPALHAAHIGVAMGEGGTDVAREAADMVLADDNFGTIVAAVEEGRTIHANVRRFIHFLLSCNAAEVLVVFLALAVAGSAALTPLQILFVNLLTDGLPALALGVEPASPAIMRRPPRRGRGLLSTRSLTPILGLGGLITVSSLVAFSLGQVWEGDGLAGRMTFATIVGAQLAASIVFRSETETTLQLRRNLWLLAAIGASVLALIAAFYLPVLQDAFDTGALSAGQWLAVAGLSLLPLVIGEAVKMSGVLGRLGLTPDGT